MQRTDVLIVGGGPVGLTASLLLSQLGVPSLLVDRRPTTSSHPRSRLVDRRTLEIFRQLGVEREVRQTGLPPEWTECNRFLESLAGEQIACIASPSFHGVPQPTSPSVPVMTSQDSVERILAEHAGARGRAELRFETEAVDVSQDETGCRATLRNLDTRREEEVSASYLIGADGVHSGVRERIGCPLGGDTIEVFFQDVLFHADLSKWVGERKGGVLFIAHEMGAGVFQPVDGKTRWRCQIGNFDPTKKITDAFCKAWIRSAVGTAEAIDIEIESIRPWQFIAGTAERFRQQRIFLAGDAAHAFIPTGGLGNNAGFAGIHNLAWKLAYVVRGFAPEAILETYDQEHGALAAARVRASLDTAARAAKIFAAHAAGGDVAAAEADCQRYGDYEGLILGFEHRSSLCIPDPEAPPALADEIRDFVPIVRAGRRAPHVWLDAAHERSCLDWFGVDYVVMLTEDAEVEAWTRAVAGLRGRGFPVRVERLPARSGGAYAGERVIVVRPDGVVAAHWRAGDAGTTPAEILARCLPLGPSVLRAIG